MTPDPSGAARAPQPLAELLAEVKAALQRMEKAREDYETGAHLTKTQQDEIDLWRQLRAAEDAIKHASPEWLGALVQAVEDQQRRVDAAEQERDQIKANAERAWRDIPKTAELAVKCEKLEAEVAQLRADGQRLRDALRDRDALWCGALAATLDTKQIEVTTRWFNEHRPDAAPAREAP